MYMGEHSMDTRVDFLHPVRLQVTHADGAECLLLAL